MKNEERNEETENRFARTSAVDEPMKDGEVFSISDTEKRPLTEEENLRINGTGNETLTEEENSRINVTGNEPLTEEQNSRINGTGNETLTKEKILAISRAENKNGDERDKQRYPLANSIGFSVGLLLAGIVILVSSLCADRFPSEVVAVVAGMQAAQALYVGITVKRLRKVYLTIGIAECVAAVALAVLWILELCGVAV